MRESAIASGGAQSSWAPGKQQVAIASPPGGDEAERVTTREKSIPPPTRVAEAAPSIATPIRPQRVRVLLIEDDPAQAEPLLELLRRKLALGSVVAYETSLVAGLRNLRSTTYDVVLLDLGLPDSQGIATVEAVRRASIDVAIIILTGYEDETTVQAGLHAGADDYFVKGQITVAGLVRSVGYAAQGKRAAKSLSDALESFRQLADSMPTIVWTARLDGHRDYYNQRWYELTGRSQENDEDQSWESVLHPDDVAGCDEAWSRAVRTGQPYRSEYRLREGSSGAYRWYLGRAVPIRNDRGEIMRWYGTGTDIHELKLAQEERARAHQELEQRVEERTAQLAAANSELEAFTWSVSHDLRAPLRAISGFSRILLAEHARGLDAKGVRYLENVQEGARQTEQLVADLLAFSHLGRQSLTMTQVRMGALVEAALAQLEPLKENRRVEITVGELPNCTADANLLQQVWINLLSNALKYTRKRDPAVIAVGRRRENGTNVFFVKDNGAGFEMKYASALFGIFHRLHSAEEYEGTGVGLALSDRIIQRHGGRIWAEAEVDRGATFSFTLGAGTCD